MTVGVPGYSLFVGMMTIRMKGSSSRSGSFEGSRTAWIRSPSLMASTMTALSSTVDSGLLCPVRGEPPRNRMRNRSLRRATYSCAGWAGLVAAMARASQLRG